MHDDRINTTRVTEKNLTTSTRFCIVYYHVSSCLSTDMACAHQCLYQCMKAYKSFNAPKHGHTRITGTKCHLGHGTWFDGQTDRSSKIVMESAEWRRCNEISLQKTVSFY